MAIVTYKCPNCGGALEFNADSQNWKCEFCLSDFNNEEVKALANDENPKDDSFEQQASQEDTEFAEKARVYSCTSCGAEIVTDETTAATFCYYCHNPAIIPKQLSGEYRPAKVIPFKFKKEAARDIFIKWCKKKPLLSRQFTSNSQLELLSGIYIPFWLFDCEARGKINAEGRKVRTWVSGNKRYTETKYYDVTRAATTSFSGIPADGSKKADDRLMETLEPYDYSQMVDFSMSYLSGYMAEKYDVDKEAVFGRISERVNGYTDTLLRNTIQGYSSVTVRNSGIDIYKSEAAYVLLPAWIFTYNYKGKTYVFAMNGQTGKIAGSLPLSKARMAAWFGIISGLVFGILSIGGMFL
ncbi:hypothetical protein [Proteiniborus sp. MB09-C3]|uniref:hypothetical protein n=1 Tax=Proteiniborus sp. MB09-C3 TaxID=3050072 RepID=UPI00255608E8|nr:hypothetical protein [Proteiniborus sp. MB09-C3]WIV12426.1 hypothetical protein QO263_01480 [Proteiniborus sp. MB09-C3]